MKSGEFAPVLPYDGSQNDNFTIYDNMKYVCRVDQYQADSPIRLHHNSLKKYYTCKYSSEPVCIGGDT